MNITRFVVSAAVVSALCATAGFAQTPSPPQSTTSPSSASSPSQRDVTHNDATETPATGSQPADASTPHQRAAMAGKPQTMKECMDQQAAKNEAMSKSAMTKACNDQMKMQKDRAHMSKAPTNPPTSEAEKTPSSKY